jgi:hypothetical protein
MNQASSVDEAVLARFAYRIRVHLSNRHDYTYHEFAEKLTDLLREFEVSADDPAVDESIQTVPRRTIELDPQPAAIVKWAFGPTVHLLREVREGDLLFLAGVADTACKNTVWTEVKPGQTAQRGDQVFNKDAWTPVGDELIGRVVEDYWRPVRRPIRLMAA